MGEVVGEGRRGGGNCKRQCCCSWCTESKFCGMGRLAKSILHFCPLVLSVYSEQEVPSYLCPVTM